MTLMRSNKMAIVYCLKILISVDHYELDILSDDDILKFYRICNFICSSIFKDLHRNTRMIIVTIKNIDMNVTVNMTWKISASTLNHFLFGSFSASVVVETV